MQNQSCSHHSIDPKDTGYTSLSLEAQLYPEFKPNLEPPLELQFKPGLNDKDTTDHDITNKKKSFTLMGSSNNVIDTHFKSLIDDYDPESPEFKAKIYTGDEIVTPTNTTDEELTETKSDDDTFQIIESCELSNHKTPKSSATTKYSFGSVCTIVAASVSAAVVGFKVIPAIGKAISAGMQGAHQHFLESDPTDPETWRLLNYWAPFMSAAAGTGVVEVVKRVKGGAEELDLESVIQGAEQHLICAEKAKSFGGGFSSDQVSIAQRWIGEARTRLAAYISKHARGLDEILPATLLPSSDKTNESVELSSPKVEKEPKPDLENKDGEQKESDEPVTPVPVKVRATKIKPVVKSSRKVTIGAMLEIAKKAADVRNPSKELLEKEDKELLTLIEALDALKEVPYQVIRLPTSKIEENIKTSPALGSRDFIANMQSRARIIAKNLWLLPKDQNKKLMVAASGPGTGKSTTFKQAIEEWASVSFGTMTGSEFTSITIPENSSAFKKFAEKVRRCIGDARINGQRVKNVVIYGDDFDRAWLGTGIFALCKDSRKKLFSFFKDVCDPTVSTIFGSEPELFSYQLAPGRFFPMDMSQVHFGISVNAMPAELLPETGESAMIDRMTNLNPAYADELDRRTIGLDFYLPNILKTIVKFYNGSTTNSLKPDKEIDKEDEDIEEYKDYDKGYDNDFKDEVNEEDEPNNEQAKILNFTKHLAYAFDAVIEGQFSINISSKSLHKIFVFCDQTKNIQNEKDLPDKLREIVRTLNVEQTYSPMDCIIKICWRTPGEIELQRINYKSAIRSMKTIVQADIEMFAIKFGRKLGIRGIKDLLDRYTVYVESKLSRPTIDPKIFSFNDGGFDLPKIIACIDGYNKQIDADMANVEDAQVFNQRVAGHRVAVSSLHESQRNPIIALLDRITTTKDRHQKQILFEEVCFTTQLIQHRVPFVSPEIAGIKLTKTLGYFKATGDLSGDIDRFPPILAVFEDIYWRMASFRRGIERENKIIRVRFADPAAESATLYSALASVVGNVPVRYVVGLETLFESNDAFGISKEHISYESAVATCKKNGARLGQFYINNATGNATVCYLLSLVSPVSNLTLFYYQLDNKNWVIKSSALAAMLKTVGNAVLHQFKSSELLELNESDSIATEVGRLTKPRLCLLDDCFGKTQVDEISAGEAFVVIKINEPIRKQINAWSETQKSSSSNSPLDKFETYLHEKLNSDSWLIKGNRLIDPRSLTVFLVQETMPFDNNGENIYSKIAIDWLVGLPPIQGREQRARATIETELQQINLDRLQRATLIGQNSSTDKPIVLQPGQETILTNLMQYDFKLAIDARAEGFKLSPSPLDQATMEFINRVKSCTNSFGLIAEFPSADSFMRSWVEIYKPEMDRIQSIKDKRRLDDEKKIRDAQVAEQLALVKLQATLEAEAGVAFKKANREAHERDWKEKQAQQQTQHQAQHQVQYQQQGQHVHGSNNGSPVYSADV